MNGKNILNQLAFIPVLLAVLLCLFFVLYYQANQYDYFGAAKSGDEERFLKFIEKGQDVNSFDAKGWTALDYASRNGHTKIVQILIDHKAQVNRTSHPIYWTPLHHAAREGHLEVMKLLLESGANVRTETEQGYKPIKFALDNSDYEAIKLLNKYGQSLEGISLFRTIHWHAKDEKKWKDRAKIVELLVNHGALLEEKDTAGQSLLLHSVYKNDLVGTKIFLKLGLDINEKNYSNQSSIHIAVTRRYPNMVRLLLESGANINDRESPDWKSLHLAARKSNPRTFSELIKHADNLNRQDSEGLTPLHIAAQNGGAEIIRILLDAGANIDLRDNEGLTPLHYAAQWKPRYDDSGAQWSDTEPRALLVLLEYGARINIEDNNSRTAMDIAQEYGEETVLNLLKNGN